MFTRKNKKNRTALVGNVTQSGMGFMYSIPFRGVKDKGQVFTIRNKRGTRIDLNGRQLNSLLSVVEKARTLASR